MATKIIIPGTQNYIVQAEHPTTPSEAIGHSLKMARQTERIVRLEVDNVVLVVDKDSKGENLMDEYNRKVARRRYNN